MEIAVPPEAINALQDGSDKRRLDEKKAKKLAEYESRKKAAIARQAQIYVRKHAMLVSDIKFRDHVQTQQQDGLESRATRKAKRLAGTLHPQKTKRS